MNEIKTLMENYFWALFILITVMWIFLVWQLDGVSKEVKKLSNKDKTK